jgi:hypothetical protein
MYASTLTLVLSLAATLGAPSEQPVRVLLDCSREYPSSWVTLAEVPGHRLTRSYATVTDETLANQDIVVIYYNHSDLPWSAVMTEAALAFVRRGGGLLILGHGGHWRDEFAAGAKYPIYQANRLAKPFGFLFGLDPRQCYAEGALQLVPGSLAAGPTQYESTEPAGVLTDLSGSSSPLVVDGAERIVAAAKQYGQGRVVCCADPDGLAPGGPNDALLRSILAWLAPQGARGGELPPEWIWPEVRCGFRGVQVAVSQSYCSEEQAEALRIAANDIGVAVEGLMRDRTLARMTVAVLPPGTADTMPDARVMEGCDATDAFPLLLEVARAAVGGCMGEARLPGVLTDALEEYCALHALASLGYPQASAAMLAHARLVEDATDAERELVSPFAAPTDPALRPLALGEAYVLLQSLAERWGPGIWGDFLRTKRREHAASGPIDAEELVTLLTRAGARDARAALHEAGLEVGGEPPPRSGR